MAETINGLNQAEVIHRREPWCSFEAVEYATFEWVDWFDHRRLLEPIDNIPPDEAEEQYYVAAGIIDMAACATSNGFRQARRGSVLVDQAGQAPRDLLGDCGALPGVQDRATLALSEPAIVAVGKAL